jgi:N-acetylneuraminic acid mutarotase
MGRKVKKKLQNKTEKEKKVKKRKSVEDIEEMLQKFEKDQLAEVEISITSVQIPSRRAGASFVTSTLNSCEIIMFGGEFFDGSKAWMYNDHLIFNTEKNSWTKISSPTQPGPRSSHQTVCTNNGFMFMFGGEFVSPNETNFFHYKDFWMLDLSTNSWEKLNIKGPSPRSGHRMALWKHLIVLYGGFFDQVHDTKYLQDLWVFDTLNFKWTEISCNDPKPSARSGFQFFTHQDKIILLGGYSQTKLKGKKFVGMMYTDSWALKMNTDLKSIKWDKLRKPGGTPPGQRTGSTTVCHKGKGIMFGGVSDIVEEEETIESVIHQDSYQYNIDSNKFYHLHLKAKDEILLPGPRFNPMMAISKNTLFMYGGILEIGQKEFTRCDLWTLNLDKLVEWNCLFTDETVETAWKGEDSSSDEGEGDGSDSEEEEEDSDEGGEELKELDDSESEESGDVSPKIEPEVDVEALKNPEDEPRPFEKLNEYATRTSIFWQEKSMEQSTLTGKSLRRLAFRYAEHHFHARRPENAKIEEQMAENEVEEGIAKAKKAESEARSRNR